jgi:hypothetical protein
MHVAMFAIRYSASDSVDLTTPERKSWVHIEREIISLQADLADEWSALRECEIYTSVALAYHRV